MVHQRLVLLCIWLHSTLVSISVSVSLSYGLINIPAHISTLCTQVSGDLSDVLAIGPGDFGRIERLRCMVLCRRGIFGGIGARRFIIIESDLSSCDFSQLSFTSEYSLNGSRSSRSRSSRASSNVSSRLWDFRFWPAHKLSPLLSRFFSISYRPTYIIMRPSVSALSVVGLLRPSVC